MTQRPPSPRKPATRPDFASPAADSPDSAATVPLAPPILPGIVSIERMIIHSLNHITGERILVDQVALLDETTASFFAQYLSAAMERAEWEATFQHTDGVVEQVCWRLFEDDDFVTNSQKLAGLLFDQMRQGGKSIAPGDLAVLSFCRDVGGTRERGVALLKLDMDEQHLRRRFERRAGVMTVQITVAHDLLPDSHALQKCALLRPGVAPHTLEVTMLDAQAGPASDGVASFFYRGFLDTKLAPSPRRHTRTFLRITEGWLSAHAQALTPREILTFYQARRKALSSSPLSLMDFAMAALASRQALQKDLLGMLRHELFESEGEQVQDSFVLDARVTRPYLKQVRLALDEGLQIIMPADRFEEMVRVLDERTPDGKWRLTIESLGVREIIR